MQYVRQHMTLSTPDRGTYVKIDEWYTIEERVEKHLQSKHGGPIPMGIRSQLQKRQKIVSKSTVLFVNHIYFYN